MAIASTDGILGIPCELSLFFGGMQQFNPMLTSQFLAEITSIFAGHRQIQIPFFKGHKAISGGFADPHAIGTSR